MPMLRSLVLIGSLLMLSSGTLSAQAKTVTCRDGTKSAGGQGACSSHGGIAAAPTVKCADGTKSFGGQGACSSHGGIAKADEKIAKTVAKADAKVAKTEAKAAAKIAKTEAKAEDRDAKGATAICKDNTYSHAKNTQGMCTGHGGVAKMLKS